MKSDRLEFTIFSLIFWACTALGAAAVFSLLFGVAAGLLTLVVGSAAVAVLLAAFFRAVFDAQRRL